MAKLKGTRQAVTVTAIAGHPSGAARRACDSNQAPRYLEHIPTSASHICPAPSQHGSAALAWGWEVPWAAVMAVIVTAVPSRPSLTPHPIPPPHPCLCPLGDSQKPVGGFASSPTHKATLLVHQLWKFSELLLESPSVPPALKIAQPIRLGREGRTSPGMGSTTHPAATRRAPAPVSQRENQSLPALQWAATHSKPPWALKHAMFLQHSRQRGRGRQGAAWFAG